MRIQLLGPVHVLGDGIARVVSSPKQATLVSVLALAGGSHVGCDRLVDALWGERPPQTARNTLQAHACAVRRLLPVPHCLIGDTRGYRLVCRPGQVDALVFEGAVATGLGLLAAGHASQAVTHLRAAVGLWRSDQPFYRVDSPWVEAERARLLALRLAATRARIDADLALGGHDLVAAELVGLCRDHPYDEGLAARLMLAYYRGDRAGDALAVHVEVRRRLQDDLGVEPGPRLTGLRDSIRCHDPALARSEGSAYQPSVAYGTA